MENSIFLKAFDGSNDIVPVWFMRQAGRYLPEYQEIKKKHSLEEMFHSPELASDITCMPIDILKVDAAILFADILTLPSAMGFDITFDNKLGPQITCFKAIEQVHDFDGLDYLVKTIQLVNQKLPENIPLIGFAGSPFTVLTYLIEGKSSLTYAKTLKFMREESELFHLLMQKLTKNTINYLRLQKEAGIHVFQLFDSWGGILSAEDYEKNVLSYVIEIFENVDLPSIYFGKNAQHLLALIDRSDVDFLSVCHTVDIENDLILNKTNKGIQGNLFNGLLYEDQITLSQEVEKLLKKAEKYPKYIFNLSHGVFPDIDKEKLKEIVKLVHQHKRTPETLSCS